MTAEDDVVLPALLRAARGTYGNAIRTRLRLAGFDDLPPNGPFILGAMANHGATAEQMLRQLGRRKPSTLALVETLLERDYLAREGEPDSASEQVLELTDRGRSAAAAVQAGVRSVDAELAAMISPEQLSSMRAGLIALCDIRERHEDAPSELIT